MAKTGVFAYHDEDDDSTPPASNDTIQQNKQDALKALKRAAALKHDSYRIWENVLVVSAAVSPPDYTSILTAQKTHYKSPRLNGWREMHRL